jgi:hypothetical protein
MPAGADQPLEANQITVAPPDHHVPSSTGGWC